MRVYLAVMPFLYHASGSATADECVYDPMHGENAMVGACEYKAIPVSTITVGDNAAPAFTIDGSHLRSRGSLKYIKQARRLGETDFVACATSLCVEIGQGKQR